MVYYFQDQNIFLPRPKLLSTDISAWWNQVVLMMDSTSSYLGDIWIKNCFINVLGLYNDHHRRFQFVLGSLWSTRRSLGGSCGQILWILREIDKISLEEGSSWWWCWHNQIFIANVCGGVGEWNCVLSFLPCDRGTNWGCGKSQRFILWEFILRVWGLRKGWEFILCCCWRMKWVRKRATLWEHL
jgi:hypothetical protein